MDFVVDIAKYIGFGVIAIILFAIPSLFILSLIFDWGFFLSILFGTVSVMEIWGFVLIADNKLK